MRSSLSFFVLAVGLLFLVKIFFTDGFAQSSRDSSPRLPPQHIQHISFGFHDVLADSFWLRFLQDIDKCYPGESEERQSTSQESICNMGWGYHMLMAIHALAPRFRIPMAVGPLSLSILQDDFKGAEPLFELAAVAFPNDWPILYRAAYHFLYEGDDPKKAAYYLTEAARKGAPEWLNSLASRIYQGSGKNELALSLLIDYRKTLTDPEQQKKVDERIKALQSSLSP